MSPRRSGERRAEAKRAKEREAAEKRRREREAEAREKAKQQRADAYWASLTPEQQAELDAASIAAADPATLAEEKGPFKNTLQQLRRDAYIRQFLDGQDAMQTEA